jgi:hypothetical protein
MRCGNLLGKAGCRLRHFDSYNRKKRRRRWLNVLLNYRKGVEWLFVFVGSGDLWIARGGVVMGQMRVNDRAMFMPGLLFNVGRVQMKERRSKKPQQNRQASLSCQGTPHGLIVDEHCASVKEFRRALVGRGFFGLRFA